LGRIFCVEVDRLFLYSPDSGIKICFYLLRRRERERELSGLAEKLNTEKTKTKKILYRE
jgi:hypothetical protein